ncbi:MAG: hypothetical protein JNL44_12630 [Gemmatimonadetes bacterium]|nr:hypothetical protein [Gemmatimonadota bacterium]
MDRRRVWKEGVVAGLLGAGGVALWFLVVDLVAGAAFATPEMLGRTLLSVLGKGIDLSPAMNVLWYTLFHVAAFVGVGLVVSRLVALSARTPGVLAGLGLFFVVFEMGFYGLTVFLSQSEQFGALAWYQIGAANLLAAFLMGWYLWRAHPELGARMTKVLEGRI